jgi:hypothetical protein
MRAFILQHIYVLSEHSRRLEAHIRSVNLPSALHGLTGRGFELHVLEWYM